MFDFSHLPENAVISEYVIRHISQTGRVQAWNRPINAKYVFILLIGGGGGGQAGVAGAAGTTRSGGYGGGSGAISQALFLAKDLPETLLVNANPASGNVTPGAGGTGSGNSGSNGLTILIVNYSNIAQPHSARPSFMQANGGAGGASGGGSGGAAMLPPSVSDGNSALLAHAIYFSSTAGRAGTGAFSGNLPSDISIGTANPYLGGAGSGGVVAGTPPIVYPGAGFTSEIPLTLPSIVGGQAAIANGMRLPFVSVGGLGGGSSDAGSGGRGGNGVGYGAGGGGGGAGVTGQSGRGGDGGPAYACIIAW